MDPIGGQTPDRIHCLRRPFPLSDHAVDAGVGIGHCEKTRLRPYRMDPTWGQTPFSDPSGVPLTLPEHLPGEPRRAPRSTPVLLFRLVLLTLFVTVLAHLTAGLWPLYFVVALVWGWPPNVPRVAQVLRYLRLTWTVRPPPPGLGFLARCWLTLQIVRKVVSIPIWGLAWLLDEILYGAALRDHPVLAPLIEISAGRSGSTQLARYLEDDPHLVAPSFLRSTFPYLWLWRLVPVTLGRVVSAEQVRRGFEAMLPAEFRERHEGDPFRTDTFESVLYLSHLNHLSMYLGPDVMVDDFGEGVLAPHNQELWEGAFVDLLDGIGRKTLLMAGPGPEGAARRFFVKGHFLVAADALARRYPDARFLTIVRDPAARIQSAVNYLRANPFDDTLGAVPWSWLAEATLRTETAYCEAEQVWYTRPDGPRRCVLRFADYVRDLEGAMRLVFRACLDLDDLPAHVPRVHAPRVRTNYLLDRSLAQLGIDEADLNRRLEAYRAWCRPATLPIPPPDA